MYIGETAVHHLARLSHRETALIHCSAGLIATGYGPAHRAPFAVAGVTGRRVVIAFDLLCADLGVIARHRVVECFRRLFTTLDVSALARVARAAELLPERITTPETSPRYSLLTPPVPPRGSTDHPTRSPLLEAPCDWHPHLASVPAVCWPVR